MFSEWRGGGEMGGGGGEGVGGQEGGIFVAFLTFHSQFSEPI